MDKENAGSTGILYVLKTRPISDAPIPWVASRIYFIISIILMVLPVPLLLFRNSTVVFLFVLTASGAIALYMLYRFVMYPTMLRYLTILGESLLLAYSLGALNTASLLFFPQGVPVEVVFGCTQQELSGALILVLSASSSLFLLGMLESPIFLDFPISEASLGSERIIWAGVIVVCAAFIFGDLGYMGIVAADNQRVSVLGSIAYLINAPLLPFTTFLLLRARNRYKKVILSLALVILLIALVPQGRRVFAYALIVTAVVLPLGGLQIKKSPKTVLVLCILGGALGYLSFEMFFALRFAIRELGTNYDLGYYVLEALDMLFGEQRGRIRTLLLENLQSRSSFLIYYLAILFAASWNHTFLFGENFMISIAKAIPSAFYPAKISALPEKMEYLVNPHFGLQATDMANSILTAGVSDFGLMGGLLYPTLLGGTYIAFDRFIGRKLPDSTRLFCELSMVYSLFRAEQTLVEYFVTIRNLLIIVPILIILTCFPFKKHRKNRATWR